MKDPHDQNEYVTDASEAPAEPAPQPKGKKRPKFSGAYYYVYTDEKVLSERAFVRTVLTLIAFALQVISLFLPPQASLEYITNELASYALIYVMAVFIMIFVSIWLAVMNMTRYKFGKRIPVEYAPKHGFGRRAFFGAELYIAINALLTVMQISFVCIKYDPITLVAVFVSALATAAATAARQVTHIALRNSELVPAAQETPIPTADNPPEEDTATTRTEE